MNLSKCCGAKIVGEVESGYGRCSDCKEMSEYEEIEDSRGVNIKSRDERLREILAELSNDSMGAVDDLCEPPHTMKLDALISLAIDKALSAIRTEFERYTEGIRPIYIQSNIREFGTTGKYIDDMGNVYEKEK